MGYNLLINGIYFAWGYNAFTHLLPTSWDIQAKIVVSKFGISFCFRKGPVLHIKPEFDGKKHVEGHDFFWTSLT